MVGRRPMPPDRRRTEKISARVTIAGKQAFVEACEKRALEESEALREAVTEWTRRNG